MIAVTTVYESNPYVLSEAVNKRLEFLQVECNKEIISIAPAQGYVLISYKDKEIQNY